MKIIQEASLRKQTSAALALLAFLVATGPGVDAKPRAVKPAPEPAALIAHLALPGGSVSQLILREYRGKQYLYVRQVSKEGFAIVDVTDPSRPNVVKREAWPNGASTGELQMVGGGLALAAAADVAMPANLSRTETIRLLDLNDPANPRAILSFSGVTGTLADEARNLVFVTNNDGLWILKYQPEQPAQSRGCLSEDAINDSSNCQ